MIWDDISKDLEKKLDSRIYKRYFKNIGYNEELSDTNTKFLEVDNVFLANWLKANYANRIALLFENHTDIKPEIRFVIKSTKCGENGDSRVISKPVQKYKNSVLNISFTFDNFVVGESNEHPYKLSLVVAKNQGKNYNPLFISGDTGLGKTHLLNAIGNFNADKNVILVSSEEFLNDYMVHLNNKSMERFREKYRQCDYLLIDDIQFFSGKHKIQEEFFSTFNILKNNNSQIVLTSDKPIKELNGIEERLKSRFESGIISHINPPEFKTKKEIIKKKCEIDLIHISDEIIEYIALNINNNIRTIEGILTTINSYSSIMNQEITLELVKNAISNIKQSSNAKITLDDIIATTAKNMNIKQADIKSKTRNKESRLARKVVIYLGRNLSSNSMVELAKMLEMKDHSTISKAFKKIQAEMENDSELKQKIAEIQAKISEIK